VGVADAQAPAVGAPTALPARPGRHLDALPGSPRGGGSAWLGVAGDPRGVERLGEPPRRAFGEHLVGRRMRRRLARVRARTGARARPGGGRAVRWRAWRLWRHRSCSPSYRHPALQHKLLHCTMTVYWIPW